MTSKKVFYILDHFFLPTPYNHRFFVEKFARGFEYNGYQVKVARKISDINSDGFVLISNHDWFHSLGGRGIKRSIAKKVIGKIYSTDFTGLSKRISFALKKFVVKRLAKHVRGKKVIVIAWFWHDNEKFFTKLKVPVIYTGEYFYDDPAMEGHRRWKTFYLSRENALPIRFSADVDPQRVGAGCYNLQFCVSYVGNKNYKPHYYQIFTNDKRNRIIPTPPYISERERISIYRNSKVVLGLHSIENISNKVVVERVFEALAYGAICVTDNPYATEATDGCAIFVGNKDECLEKVRYYCENSEARELKRKQGFKFISEKGTYAHRAREFIELARSVYSLPF